MITSRRIALKKISIGALATVTPNLITTDVAPTHIVSLSFDDGFKKSFLKAAEIFEKHQLSGCFNVLATGHLPEFKEPDAYMLKPLLGDFNTWNELKDRGHEIMPHGYKHANLSQLPFPKAQDLVLRCLDYFSNHLKGFDPQEAVFNFPFNASTPELEAWIVSEVKAFRVLGNGFDNGYNPWPHQGQVKLNCAMGGPNNIDHRVAQLVEEFLAGPQGWFIFNTHGLGDEGWGPISAEFLDTLLDRLKRIPTVKVLPVGAALQFALPGSD